MPMSRFQRIEARLAEHDRILEAREPADVDTAPEPAQEPRTAHAVEGPATVSGEPPAAPETDAQPAKVKRGKGE